MTKISNKPLLRETSAKSRGKALVIELGPHMLAIRPKGAHWAYHVDYESILMLGAKKEAELKRLERIKNRRRKGI